MGAKIIAILNQKGGTAKTTTTVNLGVALAAQGKKVLLVDFDPQGSLTYYFGLQPQPRSIAEAMLGAETVESAMLHKEGIWLVPSGNSLADAELSLVPVKNREYFLKKRLEPVLYQFDYILIDCSPSLSLLTINALAAAHEVIIPALLEVLALQGLSLVIKTIEKVKKSYNPDLTIAGVLLVLVNLEHKIAEEIYHLLKTKSGVKIFNAYIETDPAAIESPSHGKSLLAYAPDAISTIGYQNFANELLTLHAST
jgi:chromosome partitioning protein